MNCTWREKFSCDVDDIDDSDDMNDNTANCDDFFTRP